MIITFVIVVIFAFVVFGMPVVIMVSMIIVFVSPAGDKAKDGGGG